MGVQPPSRSRAALRSRSPAGRGGGMPRVLLAGNANVSLSPNGQPLATLTHPCGSSCQVLLNEARVVSWKPADGVERISVCDDDGRTLGGVSPVGVPCCSWDIGNLQGTQPDEDSLAVSILAESSSPSVGGCTATSVTTLARVTVGLCAAQLSVDLEVSNTTETAEGEEAVETSPEAEALRVELACGLRGHCRSAREDGEAASSPATSAAEVLQADGIQLRLEGFPCAALADPPAGLRERTGAPCIGFHAGSPEPLSLLPGQTVSGGIVLTLPAASAATYDRERN